MDFLQRDTIVTIIMVYRNLCRCGPKDILRKKVVKFILEY